MESHLENNVIAATSSVCNSSDSSASSSIPQSLPAMMQNNDQNTNSQPPFIGVPSMFQTNPVPIQFPPFQPLGQQSIAAASTTSSVALVIPGDNEGDPRGSHLKFPFKLHHILCEAERLGFGHIIGWIPTGDGFRVYDPKTFARTIMQKYFGMSHYKSFQRQLSLYSFKRATEGINRDAYMHPCFLRSNRELCSLVPREKKRPPKAKLLAKARMQKSRNEIDAGNRQPRHGSREMQTLSNETSGQVLPLAETVANDQRNDVSKHSVSSQIPSSSWMREHDQWLTSYVNFLVFGKSDDTTQSLPIEATEAFLPSSSQKNDGNGVSLDDVCDEIVLTFGNANDDER